MARHRGHRQLKDHRGSGPHPLLGLLSKGYGGMSIEAFYKTAKGQISRDARIARREARTAAWDKEQEARIAINDALVAAAVEADKLRRAGL